MQFVKDATMDEGPSNKNYSSSRIDLDELVCLFQRKLNYYVSLRQTDKPIRRCLIGRVPQRIYELDRSAYQPVDLSIGPYYHGNPAHQVLEKKKWNYLNYILKLNPGKTLLDYLQLVEGLEQQARNCYPKELAMESDEFTKMLLLDGCFILVALYGIQETELPAAGGTELSLPENKLDICEEVAMHTIDEQLLEKPASSKNVKYALEVELSQNQFTYSSRENSNAGQHTEHQERCDMPGPIGTRLTAFLLHDLFLLENQIPFFVVEEIYELFSGERNSSKLADRIGEFLEDILGYKIPFPGTCRPNRFHHLLHFWHLYLRPTEDREEPQMHQRSSLPFHSYFKRSYEKHKSDKREGRKKIQSSQFLRDGHHLLRWRRAEQYYEAGVHFKKRVFSENDRHSLLDIRFTNGVIEIPPLVIAWHTSSFCKNIIALEQTCPQYGNYFTTYCAFLSKIVTKPADVTLLAKRGILVHHMRTDEEVSNLLTKLGKNVDFDVNDDHYLRSLCRRIEEHYQSRANRWMAWLWHKHFSNPWLSLAVLAAAIVLLCTILQLLFAFLAYFYPAEA